MSAASSNEPFSRATVYLLHAIPGVLRERAIKACVAAWSATAKTVIITEGVSGDGKPEFEADANHQVYSLGFGCVCCIGLLPLSVTLTRSLRLDRPKRVLVVLSDDAHLEQIRQILTSPPYDQWLIWGGICDPNV